MLVLLCGVAFVASAEEKQPTADVKVETEKHEVPEDEEVDLDMLDEDLLDDEEMDPALLGMRGSWGLRGSMFNRPLTHRHMLGARPWMLRGSMLGGRRHSLLGMRGLWDEEEMEDDVEEDPALMLRRAMLMRRKKPAKKVVVVSNNYSRKNNRSHSYKTYIQSNFSVDFRVNFTC